MELSIINKVAQLVTNHKVDAALGIKRNRPETIKSDRVDLSRTGSDVATVKSRLEALQEREPERQEKIDSIKRAIEMKQYKLSEDMVNIIAEKIAQTLI